MSIHVTSWLKTGGGFWFLKILENKRKRGYTVFSMYDLSMSDAW